MGLKDLLIFRGMRLFIDIVNMLQVTGMMATTLRVA